MEKQVFTKPNRPIKLIGVKFYNFTKNIYFIGCFAEYKYNDKDDAAKNALEIFKEITYEKTK